MKDKRFNIPEISKLTETTETDRDFVKMSFAATFEMSGYRKYIFINESERDLFKRKSQTLFARFSNQNYDEKIDKNQRKNIKITKIDRQGGNFKKTKCKKLIYLTKKI